jgi:hypothetical protein
MEPKLWFFLIVCGVVGVIVLSILIDKRLRGNRYRPLSHSFKGDPVQRHDPPPLGMEAIDRAGFEIAVRRNQGLAGVFGNHVTGGRGHLAAHSVPPAPIPDDQTYAARYHRLSGKTEKDQSR